MDIRRVVAVAVSAGLAFATMTPSAAGETYRQSVAFEWDRLDIDIVVLPTGHGQVRHDGGLLPEGASDLHPQDNTYAAAAERGVAVWPAAVESFGASWLRDALRIRTRSAAREPVGWDAIAEAEVVVAFDETMAWILGTSLATRPCLVVVAKHSRASYTANDMTNIVAHEVGHCLGLGHLDLPVPRDDLMQAVYQHLDGLPSTPVHCPSNLNVAALERAFARTAGRAPAGGTAVVAPGSYRQPGIC